MSALGRLAAIVPAPAKVPLAELAPIGTAERSKQDRAWGITLGADFRKAIRVHDARQRERDELLVRIHSLAASTTIRDEAFIAGVLDDATRLLG